MASSTLTTVNTDVLTRFTPWAGTVPGGYFTYFLGNLTRAHYWAFPPELRDRYARERFERTSRPAADDNIFDWVVMLEAVVGAQGAFRMAALGAGWGRWLVAAAAAVRQFSNVPVHLIGVEAEPTHFRWMVEHFGDNGLDPNAHTLVHAAAAGESGEAWFYVGKPDSWYGQSIINDSTLPPCRNGGELAYNGETAWPVRTMGLTEILGTWPRVDYLHMDVQGAELQILSGAPDVLDRVVQRVLIGTHSHQIEVDLRALFRSLGWRCQYDVPMNGTVNVDGATVTVGDGVQVWINPVVPPNRLER